MAVPHVLVFPVAWSGADHVLGDDGEKQYRIRAVGKTPDARQVCVDIDFYPFFFVAMPLDWSAARQNLFVSDAVAKHGAMTRYSLPVTRKSLWGFTAGEARPFAQLAFPSLAAARRARYAIGRAGAAQGLKTFEACVDPIVRFFHVRGVQPAAWLRVPAFEGDIASVAFTDVGPASAEEAATAGRPPLIFASWDIEVYSSSGKFPLSDNPGDTIIQIATSFQKYGSTEPYRQTVVALDSCDPVEGLDVIAVASEADVINEWVGLLRAEAADVMIGYNTHQFDWRYVYGRSLVCLDDYTGDPLVALGGLGRFCDDGGGALREFELSSGAMGQNKFTLLETPGVLQIDLLQVMRREHKLPSYSLNAVSAEFLGDAKIDLPAAQIFEKFRGSSADRAEIARYAAKDTLLPLQLLGKLSIFENFSEMANAVAVPVDYLTTRGQQIKVFSLILRKARQLGFLCPDDERIAIEGKYGGATVLDAKKGAYFDCVSCLDYASRESPPAAARRRPLPPDAA